MCHLSQYVWIFESLKLLLVYSSATDYTGVLLKTHDRPTVHCLGFRKGS